MLLAGAFFLRWRLESESRINFAAAGALEIHLTVVERRRRAGRGEGGGGGTQRPDAPSKMKIKKAERGDSAATGTEGRSGRGAARHGGETATTATTAVRQLRPEITQVYLDQPESDDHSECPWLTRGCAEPRMAIAADSRPLAWQSLARVISDDRG
jgi:hypothetical protein